MRLQRVFVTTITILLFLLIFSSSLVASFPLEHWNTLHDIYVPDYFSAATASDVRVVAVGTEYIATSADGIKWNVEKVCDNCYLMGVAYGNGVTVVVGIDSENYTPFEVTGSIRTGGWFYNGQLTAEVESIAFYNGKFWGTDGDSIFVSDDGVNFARVFSPPSEWISLRKVLVTNNTLYALAVSSTHYLSTDNIIYRYDAGQWNQVYIGKVTFLDMVYAYGKYFALNKIEDNYDAHTFTISVSASTDLTSWQNVMKKSYDSYELDYSTVGQDKITYFNGKIFITTLFGSVITSTTGDDWGELYPSGFDGMFFLTGVSYKNNLVLAGSFFYQSGGFALYKNNDDFKITYPDKFYLGLTMGENTPLYYGIKISDNTFFTQEVTVSGGVERKFKGFSLVKIVKGNDRWVAIGAGSFNFDYPDRISYSTDSVNWALAKKGEDNYQDISFCKGTFVVRSANSPCVIYISSDGINWEKVDLTPRNIDNFACSGDEIVATGSDGGGSFIAVSTDFKNWKDIVSYTSDKTFYTAYGNGVFVVVDPDSDKFGIISDDVLSWHDFPAEAKDLIDSSDDFSLFFAHNLFILGMDEGLLYSFTGENWYEIKNPDISLNIFGILVDYPIWYQNRIYGNYRSFAPSFSIQFAFDVIPSYFSGEVTEDTPVVFKVNGLDGSVSISSISIDGDSGCFILGSNNCANLSNGESCNINLTLHPCTTGYSYAVLKVSSDSGEFVDVPLRVAFQQQEQKPICPVYAGPGTASTEGTKSKSGCSCSVGDRGSAGDAFFMIILLVALRFFSIKKDEILNS